MNIDHYTPYYSKLIEFLKSPEVRSTHTWTGMIYAYKAYTAIADLEPERRKEGLITKGFSSALHRYDVNTDVILLYL